MKQPETTVIDRGIFDVDEYLDFIAQRAPENWARFTRRGKRDLICLFQLLSRDGKEYIVLPFWGNDHEKMLSIAFVRGLAHDVHAVACGILHEAWLLRGIHQGDWKRGTRIANHPRREEVLMQQLLSNIQPIRRLRRWPVLRAHGRARLGEEDPFPPSFEWATETFLDILPRIDVVKN